MLAEWILTASFTCLWRHFSVLCSSLKWKRRHGKVTMKVLMQKG